MEDQFHIKLNKRFEKDSDDGSRVRPAFTNHTAFARIGTSVFMDVCIIPADDLIRAKEAQAISGHPEAEAEVIVLDRFVMGIDAFLQLFSQMTEMHRQLTTDGVLNVNATIIPDTK